MLVGKRMKIIVELETDNLTVDALVQIIRQMNDERDLEKFAERHNSRVKTEIASNPHTSPSTLEQLSREDSFIVKWSVAANKRTPEIALLRLATDEDFLIRERIAERDGLSDSVILVLSQDKDDKIREFARKEIKRRDLL